MLNALEIQQELNDQMDSATIYRNLQKFLEDGILKKVNLQSEISSYELNSDHSHQHFICTSCGLIESIEIVFDKIIRNLPKTLKVEEVEMNVKGKCADCLTCLQQAGI